MGSTHPYAQQRAHWAGRLHSTQAAKSQESLCHGKQVQACWGANAWHQTQQQAS
jgi:hypothetical protein